MRQAPRPAKFGEIVTSFRLSYGGAQERYGVMPDISTLGKIIDSGFPLAALGASAQIMAHFDKEAVGADKWQMQLGTLSGNPVAAIAGLKTTEVLRRSGQYARLRTLGQELLDMIETALNTVGIDYRICGYQTQFDLYFTSRNVTGCCRTKHDKPHEMLVGTLACDTTASSSHRANYTFASH